MNQMPSPAAVQGAAFRAVYVAVARAVGGALERAVGGAVNVALDLAVNRDVEGAVEGALWRAIRHQPPHPNLLQFLTGVRLVRGGAA